MNDMNFPILILNQYCIRRFLRVKYLRVMSENGFKDGKFKENAFAIDINCRKFPVRDVKFVRPSFNPLLISLKSKAIIVKYMFDEPEQMEFEAVRNEIVELICSRGWYRQGSQNETDFRRFMSRYKNMADLLFGAKSDQLGNRLSAISFYGKWVF